MNTDMQLQTIGEFTVADMETMRHTLAKDANNDQFALFVRTAAAAGLNPFLNHIYCIVYAGKMSIQISVEGIVYLAKRVEGYQGIDTQLVHENDEFEASIDKDGRWVIDSHKIKFPRGKVIGCYSIAYRENFRPVTEFMEVDEVQHHLSGNNAANWKKYFNDFFKKTVTKRSAKRQFGIEVSEDEAQTGGSDVPEYKPGERRDITAEVDAATGAEQPKKQAPLTPAEEGPKPLDDEPPTTDPEAEKLLKDIEAAYVQLGITERKDRAAHAKEHARLRGQAPTKAELKAYLKVLKLQVEDKELADAVETVAAGEDVIPGLE